MVSWLLEDRWTIVALGALALFLLTVALLQTRRGGVLIAMGVALLLTILGLVVEWWVVTDREAVEDTVRVAAEAIRSGEPREVLRFIAPEAEDVRGDVERYMGLIEFTSIAINSPETEVFDDGRRARVRFTARIEARAKGGVEIIRDDGVVYLEVRFRKASDQGTADQNADQNTERWLVTSYERLKLFPGEP